MTRFRPWTCSHDSTELILSFASGRDTCGGKLAGPRGLPWPEETFVAVDQLTMVHFLGPRCTPDSCIVFSFPTVVGYDSHPSPVVGTRYHSTLPAKPTGCCLGAIRAVPSSAVPLIRGRKGRSNQEWCSQMVDKCRQQLDRKWFSPIDCRSIINDSLSTLIGY